MHVSVPETPHDLCSVEIVAVHDAAFPYVPALHVQALTDALALGELELVRHGIHAAQCAPTVVEYVPAPQSVHTALPVAILYLPATQAVHAPPAGPVNPALQIQSVRATLVVGELEPAGQLKHAALPVAVLYLPAAHCVHGVVPVNPAAHATAHVTLQVAPIPPPTIE